MVVEYVTSLVAAGVLFWLPRVGTFRVTEDDTTQADLGLLIRLVIFQAVPEFLIDMYSCALEIRGGLSAQYAIYWRSQTFMMILWKIVGTGTIAAFCLGISIVVR